MSENNLQNFEELFPRFESDAEALIGNFIWGHKEIKDIVQAVLDRNDPQFKQAMLDRIAKDIGEFIQEEIQDTRIFPDEAGDKIRQSRKDAINKLQILQEQVQRILI